MYFHILGFPPRFLELIGTGYHFHSLNVVPWIFSVLLLLWEVLPWSVSHFCVLICCTWWLDVFPAIWQLEIWPYGLQGTPQTRMGLFLVCMLDVRYSVRTFVANQKHKERSKIIVSWRLVFFPVNLVLKILLAVAYFEISATAISAFWAALQNWELFVLLCCHIFWCKHKCLSTYWWSKCLLQTPAQMFALRTAVSAQVVMRSP